MEHRMVKKLFKLILVCLTTLLSHLDSGVNGQNCALPRVVTISPTNNPALIETAPKGTVLVSIPSHNILAVQTIPHSPTNFVGVGIEGEELVLTLVQPLKNYLDDSRSKTVDFKAEFQCKDGRNKTAEFKIPFKDENTKVPRFSKALYTGNVTLPWPTDEELQIDDIVTVIDEDRDQKNAEICVGTSDEIGISVSVAPIYLVPHPLNVLSTSTTIPDDYRYRIALFLRPSQNFVYQNNGRLRFTLSVRNLVEDSECPVSSDPGLADDGVGYTEVDLIINWNGDPTTTDPQVSTPPTEPVCSLVQFKSFYYKAVVTNLDEALERSELQNISPGKISATSSSGRNVLYELGQGSEYFRIDSVSGRVYFIKDVGEDDVEQMPNNMEIVEIRASDGFDSYALVSLIVLFEIRPSTATTPGSSTTTHDSECPTCPGTTTAETPGECPDPSCPTPEPCPTSTTVITTHLPTTTSTVTTTTGRPEPSTESPTDSPSTDRTEQPTTVTPTALPTTEPPELSTNAPTSEQPEFSTIAPTSEHPELTTNAPTTEQPEISTNAPTTEQPEISTIAPTTEQPVFSTNAPTTEPPEFSTNAPTTEPPEFSTNAPTTEQPEFSTNAPTTEQSEFPTNAPTTEQTEPSTNAPTTEPPAFSTNGPTTEQPEFSTNAPTTEQPEFSTIAPTSEQPEFSTHDPTDLPITEPSTIGSTEYPTTSPSDLPTPVPTESPTTPSDPEPGECPACECEDLSFMCPGTGEFADPHSCKHYYNCGKAGENGTRQVCADGPGVNFCPEKKRCDYCDCVPPKPPCCPYCPCTLCQPGNSTSNICESEGEFPDPDRCNLFHQCQIDDDGEFVDCYFTCQYGLIYCPDTKACDWIGNCPTACPDTCETKAFWSRGSDRDPRSRDRIHRTRSRSRIP